MGIFPDAQGQVSPQSMIGSDRISNLSETYGCPHYLHPIKMKALNGIFFRCSKADISVVSDGLWPSFELIQAFMHVVDTCKSEDDPVKNKKLAASKAYSIPPQFADQNLVNLSKLFFQH